MTLSSMASAQAHASVCRTVRGVVWETWCIVTISHGLSVLRCACMVRREQFSIPQATPAYEEMVQQLPSEFVGPASSKLTALVTPLSAASCLSI